MEWKEWNSILWMCARQRPITLLDLGDELLLKIMDSIDKSDDAAGLLLSCRHLSDLARPNVYGKRQREVCITKF